MPGITPIVEAPSSGMTKRVIRLNSGVYAATDLIRRRVRTLRRIVVRRNWLSFARPERQSMSRHVVAVSDEVATDSARSAQAWLAFLLPRCRCTGHDHSGPVIMSSASYDQRSLARSAP